MSKKIYGRMIYLYLLDLKLEGGGPHFPILDPTDNNSIACSFVKIFRYVNYYIIGFK